MQWFHKLRKNKTDKKNSKSDICAKEDTNEVVLSSSLKDNVAFLHRLFVDDDTLVTRNLQNKEDLKLYLFYSDGLVNSITLNEHIVAPLLNNHVKKNRDSIDILLNHVLQVGETKTTTKIKDIIQAITYGDTVVFVEGQDQAIILNTKSFFMRAITEPDNEKAVSGPREGFGEVLLVNLSLIRRRLRTHDLKMKYYSIGERTQTQACICYLDSLVDKKVLDELYRRLKKIKIDGVLDANYIAENIRDAKYTLFRQTGTTEKPDSVVGKLLEGRIAVFVDGSPIVMTLPYLFIENFQMGDDYFTNFFYASIARILRMTSYFFSILTPGLYLVLVAFHKEMIPTVFFLNVAAERSSVPFPVIIEMTLMLIVFDFLREAGLRMPSNVGSALSIVGALVIGQAAVDAKLLDAPVIIVVGFSAITSLLTPRMGASITVIRLAFIAGAGLLGLYGFIMVLIVLIVHLYNLRSMGVPQLQTYEDLHYQSIKDIFIRGPWFAMKKRPDIAQDIIRLEIDDE
jgi:spore germination protein KA